MNTNTDETVSAAEAPMGNCFRANTNEICEGIPVLKGPRDYFVDFGHGVKLSVYEEIVDAAENLVFFASIWSGKGPQSLGACKPDEKASYLLIDTGVPGADKHALQGVLATFGAPVELYRGRTEIGLRFLYQMLPGDQLAIRTADGKLHNLTAVLGDIEPFDIETARVEEINRAIQLNEALLLIALTGDKAKGARQAGLHRLLDLFGGGADGGAEALGALIVARKLGAFGEAVEKRFDREVRPHLVDLVRGYGWITSEVGSQVIWVHDGVSYTAYVPSVKKKETPKEAAGRREARKARDLARTQATKKA